jgi:hypothetical protein
MPLIHAIDSQNPKIGFSEVFIEAGTVCRSYVNAKQVLLAEEDIKHFKLNMNSDQVLTPFHESYSIEELQQEIRGLNDEATDLVLVFTAAAFRHFKQWVRSEDPDWVNRFSYLLIPNTCRVQFINTDVNGLSKSSNSKISDRQVRNIHEIKKLTAYYWSTLTKGTKFGFFWLAFRAVASPIPILFVAISSISGPSGLAPLERVLLSLSLFSLTEGGIKHGVRSWRRLRKLEYTKSRAVHVLFLGLVGFVDAAAFLAASLIISIINSGPKELYFLLSIWILSAPSAIFLGGLIGVAIEAIAKKFWDIKFLVSYISLAILITTPVLIIPSGGWLSVVQDNNPLSWPYNLTEIYFSDLSTNREVLIIVNLSMFFGFLFILIKKVKIDD